MAEEQNLDPEVVHLAIRTMRGDEDAWRPFMVAAPSGLSWTEGPEAAALEYLRSVRDLTPLRQRDFEAQTRTPLESDALAQARGTDLYRKTFEEESERYREPETRKGMAREAPHQRQDMTRGFMAEQTARSADWIKTGEKPRLDPMNPVSQLSKNLAADDIYDLARMEAAEAAVNEAVRQKDAAKPEKKVKDERMAKSMPPENAGAVTAGVP